MITFTAQQVEQAIKDELRALPLGDMNYDKFAGDVIKRLVNQRESAKPPKKKHKRELYAGKKATKGSRVYLNDENYERATRS